MPPDSGAVCSANEWLRRARSDLALAGTKPVDPILCNDLCFHAQQAVEKAIKAVLVSRQIIFPRTHLLELLLNLLPPSLPSIPGYGSLADLSVYAVIARYPGDYEDTTDAEWQHAVRQATAVVRWAETVIGNTSNGN